MSSTLQSMSQEAYNYEPQPQQGHTMQRQTNHQPQDNNYQQYSSDLTSDSDEDIPVTAIIQKRTKKSQTANNQQNFADQSIVPKGKQYHQNTYTKYDSRISLHHIQNEVDMCEAKEMVKEKKNKDKAQRATVQQVLDPRTRKILVKLITKQIVSEINGCISTGKEANVYYAKNNKSGKQYAIKIYKTSILVFKDRDRYVEGQFRFRRGYCSSNPRKMVAMWAEKELRNLKRIQGIIASPVGLLVKSNVLVMDFIGENMQAAPRLKDAIFENQQEISNVYLKVLKDMRVLYQKCKLIHADLSQYNLLYYQGLVYMIDVSQSVQYDHPEALAFLRRDITNINIFFDKKSVKVFSDWSVFAFIVGFGVKEGEEMNILENMAEKYEIGQQSNNQIQSAVFRNITIPRNLSNIPLHKVENQIFAKTPTDEEQYHKVVTGLNTLEITNKIQQENSSEDSSEESQQDKQGEQQNQDKKQGGKQKYEGLSKLQRKHKVKEQKREKRKQKIPKKQKKKFKNKKSN